MPALPSPSLLSSLVDPNTVTDFVLSSRAVNNTNGPDALQVICAWPVSGQYGPGSRVLYYVLVAACVFAQRAEWLRNACLAAALLFPAVAAIHGIVLAAKHVDGAVDMDIYGAFQLCSIGILAAMVTVRLSPTYFYDPGRNTIFLWTGLILAGLLSLTVEFYRINTHDCKDDLGNKVFLNPGDFNFSSKCGLRCSEAEGPFSPMRGGPANDIFVIPAPDKLNFGTATLLAAACCIPAILSLISMWNKILEINWKTRFGRRNEIAEPNDELIEGTNGATTGKMNGVNDMIRLFLGFVEIPVFSGAVLTILIIGERNFFSPQVRHETEPMTSIGQWAPIVGAGLAVFGSLYLVLAADVEAEERRRPGTRRNSINQCECSHFHHHDELHPNIHVKPSDILHSSRSRSSNNDGNSSAGDSDNPQHHQEMIQQQSTTRDFGTNLSITSSNHSSNRPSSPGTQSSRQPSPTHLPSPTPTTPPPPSPSPSSRPTTRQPGAGHRRKIAKSFIKFRNKIGPGEYSSFNDEEFKHGEASTFPEIPGEEGRNPKLQQIKESFNVIRGNVTPAATPRPSSPRPSEQIERGDGGNFMSGAIREGDGSGDDESGRDGDGENEGLGIGIIDDDSNVTTPTPTPRALSPSPQSPQQPQSTQPVGPSPSSPSPSSSQSPSPSPSRNSKTPLTRPRGTSPPIPNRRRTQSPHLPPSSSSSDSTTDADGRSIKKSVVRRATLEVPTPVYGLGGSGSGSGSGSTMKKSPSTS